MDGRLGEGVFSLLRCSTTQTQVPEYPICQVDKTAVDNSNRAGINTERRVGTFCDFQEVSRDS